MSTLKVESLSNIDLNLEDEWDSETVDVSEWLKFVKDLPGVLDAKWVDRSSGYQHTLITFESEAHKSWFILRWS